MCVGELMTKAQSTSGKPTTIQSRLPSQASDRTHHAQVGEDDYARLAEEWPDLYEKLQSLDLTDESQWGEPIEDVQAYLKNALGEGEQDFEEGRILTHEEMRTKRIGGEAKSTLAATRNICRP
jgi:predicted transcriptional regulator